MIVLWDDAPQRNAALHLVFRGGSHVTYLGEVYAYDEKQATDIVATRWHRSTAAMYAVRKGAMMTLGEQAALSQRENDDA